MSRDVTVPVTYSSLTTRVVLVLVALTLFVILAWLARLPVAAVALATIFILHMAWRRARRRQRNQVPRVGTSISASVPRAYQAPYVLTGRVGAEFEVISLNVFSIEMVRCRTDAARQAIDTVRG